MEFRTIEELLTAYNKGERKFENWDFDEDGSVQGVDLSGIEFKSCFLFLDFRNSNLTNAKFIECNIKTADFTSANLSNALIKNCSIESTIFKNAILQNALFEENYAYGSIVSQEDFNNMYR